MGNKNSLTNKTLNGFIWSGIGTIAKSVLQIAVIAILARLIDVKSFGVVQAAMVVVGFATLISQMGIGPALVQRKDLTSRHIRMGFTLSLLLGLLLGGLLFIFANYFASFFNIEELKNVVQVLSLLFLVESFITVSASLLQRNMRFKEMALIDLISYFMGYGLIGIIFGYLGYGYWALIMGIFAQALIKIGFYFFLQRHSLIPLWSKKEFLDLIHYGGGHTLAKFTNYFAGNGDNFIVGRFLGAQALGFYGQALTLVARPFALIVNAMDQALFPALSAVQDNKATLRDTLEKAVKVLTLLVLPLIFIISILAENIVLLILGEKWLNTVTPLQILSLTIIFRITTRISDVLVRATGDVYSRAWRRSISAVVMFVSCYIGHFWGLAGVAWGVVFTSFVTFLLMASLTFKHIDMGWIAYLKLYLKGIILSFIFGVACLLVKAGFEQLITSNIIVLIGSLMISGLVYLGFLIGLKSFFLGNEKIYIVMILNKMKLQRLVKFID